MLRRMNYWPIVICGLLGMGIVLVMVPAILKAAGPSNRFQRGEDLHHTHEGAIPRLGGLALVVAFIGVEILIVALWPEEQARIPGRTVVLISSPAMFALGFWDDLKPLGA